jgi:hypothetical protein
MVATYKAAARFIQRIRDRKIDPRLLDVSFVGSEALAEELRELGPGYARGVIVTQVVPHPSSMSAAPSDRSTWNRPCAHVARRCVVGARQPCARA